MGREAVFFSPLVSLSHIKVVYQAAGLFNVKIIYIAEYYNWSTQSLQMLDQLLPGF